MKKLLQETLRLGISPVYAQKLLNLFGDDRQERAPENLRQISSAIIVEALTQRELDVLRLLETELSAPKIADELVLSIETVRTHIKRIYRKLDVHSRFEAVLRGKELGLL